ncbi:MAG: carboxylesterase family protein [Caulobacter sp.]|nr:carboxylesterase family protein [Caulobacter sp.]
MRGLIALGLAALALAAGPVAARADGPVVATREGRLAGVAGDKGVSLFLGVPFAQPPVRDRRWRPPGQVTAWSGDRAADKPGPACLQTPRGWNDKDAARSSEDCLYLDVATPRLDPAAGLPVMVWIHGGANHAGSGDGVVRSSLARQGVVVVSVQYRLGVFGFLSHPGLTAEGGGASGNYALMDLVAALTWVHENIAAFGGDPGNVTLFGHSAGGQDVGLLMLAPGARGLFARGILQSGTPGFGFPPRSLAQNEAIGAELARRVGAPAEEASAAAGLAALRGASGQALLAAAKNLPAPIDDKSFIWTQAVVDGAVLPRSPAALLSDPASPLAPMIVGSSAREIALFDDDPARARTWVKTLDGETAKTLTALYGLDRSGLQAADPVDGTTAVRVATDRMFRCPGDAVAAIRTAAGARVWRYQLEVPSSGEAAVRHGSELRYVFDGLEGAPMQAYWLNFARTGDPNGPGLPTWPGYGAEGRYLAFTEKGPVARDGLLGGAACARLKRP